MFDNLNKMLEKVDADYADVRYEKITNTTVTFNCSDLSGLGASTADGYVLRVLKNGGFASVSFTSASDVDRVVKKVVKDTRVIAQHTSNPETLAPVEAILETYKPLLNEDPRKISLEEKKTLTRCYNDIPLGHDKVVSTQTGYMDQVREKYLISTEGTAIQEDLITTRIGCLITAAAGAEIRKATVGIGGSQGFAHLRNKEAEFEKKTALAVDLLSASPVEGGIHNVILDPGMAGLFTHEAFGHLSEADIIELSPSMGKRMTIGAKLGPDILNITDDPTLRYQLGHYKYDDEGVAARTTALMKNGALTGRLHSRCTAARFNEPVTGHCVAEDYRYAPIIRMGNIFIEPGSDTLESLMESMGEGYYFAGGMGGQTAGENFTFASQYGYRVRSGKKAEMVRDTSISGNLYKTLHSIEGVADDLTFEKTGGCGKMQTNIRSCYGAPHVLINQVVVGSFV